MINEVDNYPDIDVVIPINTVKYMPYLGNCCNSILWQEYPRDRIHIIVSYAKLEGENEDIKELAHLCRRTNATLVFHNELNDGFNFSRAKNIAALHGSGEILLFMEADIVVPSNLLLNSYEFITTGGSVVVRIIRCPLLPDDDIYKSSCNSRWLEISKTTEIDRGALGVAMVSRGEFLKIHGHDEDFYGWGADDWDFWDRITKDTPVKGTEDIGCVPALHQYHNTRSASRTDLTERNRKLFYERIGIIIRNDISFGGYLYTIK